MENDFLLLEDSFVAEVTLGSTRMNGIPDGPKILGKVRQRFIMKIR